jgi:hypothetical protein
MIINATKEAPKNCKNVIISTVNVDTPTPKIICPVPVSGVVAGSVAMKNVKNIELPISVRKSSRTR